MQARTSMATGALLLATLGSALLAGLSACAGTGAADGEHESPPPAAEGALRPAPPAPAAASADLGMPYVYTEWEQITTADGLPNDHIFAVRVAGDDVWVGTEGGLARVDARTREIQAWREEDGLPWRVISGVDVDPETGDVWLALFGGGLARLSGGRFEHWHQLNSGLVNDVVYAVCVENRNVWAATTAGASRLNTITGEWTIFTEKNAPMEEIWNYGCSYADGLVYLAVWGSGILEYDVERGTWNEYLDPDGEMEIDLYRDDGIVHVITTGVHYIDKVLWVTSYFGASRYDGRHWRGYYKSETGIPSDFHNGLRARGANEAWFCTDQGLAVLADFESDTWVTYTTDHATHRGQAVVRRGAEVLCELETPPNIPHEFVQSADFHGSDAWVGTSKGLGHAIGTGYYLGLRPAAR
ncbi:MAG: regulator [Planctomycetota bacterium]